MNKKWVRIAFSILVLSLLAGWFFWNRSTEALPEIAESAVPSATRVGSDVLRYPADAPQLSMIQSKNIQPSPMPLTDALSARLAYNEDVTARIGVGFTFEEALHGELDGRVGGAVDPQIAQPIHVRVAQRRERQMVRVGSAYVLAAGKRDRIIARDGFHVRDFA